jgi:SAM-dependent methyltransferase
MESTPESVLKLLKYKKDSVLKLDIVTGESKEAGFISIGARDFPGADIIWDVEILPWPLPDESFTLASAAHIVHRINPHHGGFIRFMDEVWRVLKYEGQFRIATPFAGSTGYWSDPLSINGCTPQTWHYFDPLQPTGLYKIHKPKPWKVEQCYWQADGLMEVLLSKRRIDPSYEK